jgi:Kef-type K+ transport system membrane component KefB
LHRVFGLNYGLSDVGFLRCASAAPAVALARAPLAESSGTRVRDLAHGVSELLVPFFLAGIGLHVSLSAFSTSGNAMLALVILLAAVASKFIGCALGALGLGKADALRIGVGMIPRGEVGMVVAQIGLGFGIISQNVYAVVVFMSVATTIVAPPLIKLTFRSLMNSPEAEEPEEAFRLG